MGHIIVWILLGLVIGALAKFIMPGRDPGGIIVTIVIGIAGALIGGFITEKLNLAVGEFGSFVMAVLGAILLLFILRVLRRAA